MCTETNPNTNTKQRKAETASTLKRHLNAKGLQAGAAVYLDGYPVYFVRANKSRNTVELSSSKFIG